jgi:hypothetical protein
MQERQRAYRRRQQASNTSRRLSIPEHPFHNVLDLGPVQLSQGPHPSSMPSFDQFVNSLAAPPSTELPSKRRRTVAYPTAPEAAKLAVGLLDEEFELRVTASETFPPSITSSHIRASVTKYEDNMSAVSERSVCCCCGRLIAAGDIYEIYDGAHSILPPQRILDRCGRHENSWDFCTVCHGAVSRGNIPKFSALNLVSVTTCQDYPSALEDLTIIYIAISTSIMQ